MKISRLEIKNCLGIKELEVRAGKVNLIKGGNEKGKTSLLEVIEKGLRNTERRAKFVRDGEEEATLYIELDDGLVVDRKIKADGKSTIKLTRNGEKLSKPETLLKSIAGEFNFNPIDFMNKKDKEQTEILLSLIPMRVTEEDLQAWFGEVPPVNLNQHAIDVLTYLAEKYFYDKRALANGEVKECNAEIQALFEQLPDNYDGDQWREVNIGALWAKVQEAEKVNNYRRQARETINNANDKIQAIENKYKLLAKEKEDLCTYRQQKARESIESEKQAIRDAIQAEHGKIEEYKRLIAQCERNIELKQQELKAIDGKVELKTEALANELDVELKNLEEKREIEVATVRQRVERARKYLADNPEVEVQELREKAEEAERMKGYISLYDNMKKLQKDLKLKQDVARHLDECVNLARQKPAELLKQIELPIDGLDINKDMQITIDGMPISNLSTSRQIKLALDIARATAGPLKMICIDRFESLDAINQEYFFKEIQNDDFQYFITTTILDKDPGGNYITDLTVQAI